MFCREGCCLQTVTKIFVTSREIWGQMLIFFLWTQCCHLCFYQSNSLPAGQLPIWGGKRRQDLVFPNCSHLEEMDLIFEISAHIQAILSYWDLAMHCLEGTGLKGQGRSWQCFLLRAGKSIYSCPQLFAWKIKLLKGQLKTCCKY